MAGMFRKSAAAFALLASVSMAATPALARDRGWGGDWGRHRDRVDAGDVITGILIIGGIAAIASAASNDEKRQRERERQEREARDYRYEDRADPSGGYGEDSRPEWRAGSSCSGTSTGVGGINVAIDRCVSEIERGSERVDGVETAAKQGDGWRIEGRMAGGEPFACTIDRDGRIRSASVGGGAY